jgi:hypothetical protein
MSEDLVSMPVLLLRFSDLPDPDGPSGGAPVFRSLPEGVEAWFPPDKPCD